MHPVRGFGTRVAGDLHEYRVSLAKPIMAQTSEILARHYGFTEEELDFIINYDIKYRMGNEAGE